MKNVRLALQTLTMLGFPVDRISLIANRAGMAGGVSVQEVADTLGRSIRFVLPDDPLVPTSINAGKPVMVFDPRSKFARGVEELVGTLIANGNANGNGAGRIAGRRFRRHGAVR
jgi:MinD-like ATPase involved in chromosome partitioning or flagellar assembly